MNIQEFILKTKKTARQIQCDVRLFEELLTHCENKSLKRVNAWIENKCVCDIEELMINGCNCAEFKQQFEPLRAAIIYVKDKEHCDNVGKNTPVFEKMTFTEVNASVPNFLSYEETISAIEKAGNDIFKTTNEQLSEKDKRLEQKFLVSKSNLFEVVEDVVYKHIFEIITDDKLQKIKNEIIETTKEECKIFPQKRGIKVVFDKLNKEVLIL